MVKNSKSAKYIMTALVILTLSAFIPSYASTKIPASGNVVLGDVIAGPEFKFADGNTFITQTREVTIHGTFEGSNVNEQRIEIHPDGWMNFQELITFTGTVSSVGEGTILMRAVGTISPSGTVQGNLAILSGTGDLENLRGDLKLGGNVYVVGGITYFGSLHVAP